MSAFILILVVSVVVWLLMRALRKDMRMRRAEADARIEPIVPVVSPSDRVAHAEEFFRLEMGEGKIDFAGRAFFQDGQVRFYLHPEGRNGRTMDFEIDRNAWRVIHAPPR